MTAVAGWRFDTVALAEAGTRWARGGGESVDKRRLSHRCGHEITAARALRRATRLTFRRVALARAAL